MPPLESLRLLLLEEEVKRAPAAAVKHIFAMLNMSKQRRPCVNNLDLFFFLFAVITP